MGFLSLFSKPAQPPLKLSAGSFTVDRSGNVLVTTLPSSFPEAIVHDIGREVLAFFQDARTAQLPSTEVIVSYPSLKVVARELRGGAIIFLTPETALTPAIRT
ncbi:MAG TPA: hypothetical protein VKA67_13965 [Verrucomicrobiae bacterium]|nr:hypothetical protein [Verrucomicrobiae bacterium]